MSDRYGDFIGTYSGGRFWPLDPRPEEVLVEDVAHALSMVCRFTGHCARFYSVAEHCVLVSRLVPREDALAGLLHDAAEAYVADVSSPVKRSAEFAPYREVEDRIQRTVYARFGLAPEMPEFVHLADRLLCVGEARVLFRTPPSWVVGKPGIGENLVVGLPPAQAEVLYLERFKELGGRG